MQNSEIKESIWADGVPKNVKEEMKLNTQDLLLLAVDYVVRNVAIPNGFKIEQAIAKLGYYPNIVMRKNDQLYFIIVVPFLYPYFGFVKEDIRIRTVNDAQKFNAKVYCAPVGLKSTDNDRAEAQLGLKGDTFNYLFRGFVELTNEKNENPFPTQEQFVML